MLIFRWASPFTIVYIEEVTNQRPFIKKYQTYKDMPLTFGKMQQMMELSHFLLAAPLLPSYEFARSHGLI